MTSNTHACGLSDDQVAVAYLLGFFLEQNGGTGRISKDNFVRAFSMVGAGTWRLSLEEDPDRDLILRLDEMIDARL